MASKRSTRDRIKTEGIRAVYDIEKCMEKLKRVDELADGRSDVINMYLPGLVQMLDGVHKVMTDFHSKL